MVGGWMEGEERGDETTLCRLYSAVWRRSKECSRDQVQGCVSWVGNTLRSAEWWAVHKKKQARVVAWREALKNSQRLLVCVCGHVPRPLVLFFPLAPPTS